MNKQVLLYHFIICIVMLLLNGSIHSQDIIYTNYSPTNGLAEGRVQQIVQEKYGRIVVRGWETFSVLDGQKIRTYDNYNGVPLGYLNTLRLNKDGEAELFNAAGVKFILRKNKVIADSSAFYWKLKAKSESLIEVFESEDNVFYSGNKLYAKENGTMVPIYEYQQNDVSTRLAYVNGFILIEHNRYLKLIDVSKRKVVQELKYDNQKIERSCIGQDKNVYLQGKSTIYVVDRNAMSNGKIDLKIVVSNWNLLNDGRNVLTNVAGGKMYLVNNIAGVHEFDLTTKASKSFTVANGVIRNATNVFADAEKNIWIISSSDGIQKVETSTIQPLNKTKANKSDKLYATTPNEIGLPLDNSFTVTDGIKAVHYNKQSTDLMMLKWNNALWRETEPFYYKADNGRVVDVRPLASFLKINRHVYQTAGVDKQGNLLLVADYIVMIQKKDLKPSVNKLYYFTDNIVQDEQNKYYAFNRAKTIEQFELQNNELVKQSNSIKFSEAAVRYAMHWNKDSFLVATRNMGLLMVKIQQDSVRILKTITTADGLNSNFVNSITLDKSKQIWLGTFVGVNKVLWNNGNCIIESVGRRNRLYAEDKVLALLADSTKVVVSGMNGIYLIDATGISQTSQYVPHVYWNEIKVNDKPLDDISKSKFSHAENNFEFLCSATSFLSSESIMFHYTIVSGSDTIRRVANDPLYKLSNLSPGKYTVSVRVEFPNSNYESKTLTYSFIITPPIYARWWFILLSVALGIAVIAIPIRLYFRNQLQKREAELMQKQAVANERNRIAADMHDDLGSGLTRINYASQRALKGEMNSAELARIQEISTSLIDSMREIIWAMKEENNNVEELIYYVKSYASEYCTQHGLKCNIHIPDKVPMREVRGENRRQIFLCIKELLHNVVKHAQADTVTIQLLVDKEWRVVITDDGVGLPVPHQPGNGTVNIRKRIESIGGSVAYVPVEKGTQVVLFIPL